ncbi:hypothetical protein T484DRAFT_1831876 [Baffinella frigidus]|nr:hypothetical protein T484DRAFT_1831876 [Cryptophyta sp. CCMP2293]
MSRMLADGPGGGMVLGTRGFVVLLVFAALAILQMLIMSSIPDLESDVDDLAGSSNLLAVQRFLRDSRPGELPGGTGRGRACIDSTASGQGGQSRAARIFLTMMREASKLASLAERVNTVLPGGRPSRRSMPNTRREALSLTGACSVAALPFRESTVGRVLEEFPQTEALQGERGRGRPGGRASGAERGRGVARCGLKSLR